MQPGASIFFPLFSNLAIFIVLVAVYGYMLGRLQRHSRVQKQFILGLLFGIFAIGCMHARIPVADGVILDQRNAIVALSGIFGGPLSAILAAAMTGSFRLYLGGEGALSGFTGVWLAAAAGWFIRQHWKSLDSWQKTVSASFVATLIILPGFLVYGSWPTGWELMKAMALPYGGAIFIGIALLGELLRHEDHRFEAAKARDLQAQKVMDFAKCASDWWWETDADGCFTYVSERFEEQTETPVKHLIGNRPELSLPGLDSSMAGSLISLLGAQKAFRDMKLSLKSADERILHFRVSATPHFDTQGVFQGFRGVAQDCTHEKLSQEKLGAALTEAKAAMIAKSQFIANMSHEIRTPMNGIMGMVQVLADTSLDSEQRELLTIISSSGDDLMQLICEILDFSKLDANGVELHLDTLNLEELCQECLCLMGHRAQEKGVFVALDYDPGLCRCFIGDVVRLRQIMINLLSNAVKFTPSGYIVLRVKALSQDQLCADLELSLEDTGIGIPEEACDRIFQEFTQVDESDTRHHGGVGLGLAIVQKLVFTMGGDISCQSIPGEGSCFRVKLRLPKDQEMESPIQRTLVGKKILLFSKNKVLGEIYVAMLQALGAEVHWIESMGSIEEYMQQALTTNSTYHYALLDFGRNDELALSIGLHL